MSGPLRCAVIGAGIVGLSCAHALRRDGHAVSVIDPDPAGDKASFGNAGAIAVSEILPAAGPGIIWQVPGWLADPLGPLSLKPRHLPRLLPWLVRFLRSGTPAESARITRALVPLLARVLDDYGPLLDDLGLAGDLHRVGALWVYETKAGWQRDAAGHATRRRHGIAVEEMSGAEARRLEPALGALVDRGAMTPAWSHVSDPKRIVDGLREALEADGVAFVARRALGTDGQAVRTAGGDPVPFDRLVVAAGAWSGALAKQLGDRALIESERGYNATLPNPGVAVGREVIFAERQFVATPLSIGLRIGGAAEFAGLVAPANHRRSDALVTLAKRYLPDLDSRDARQWMGHRPTTPDSLPVIGPSRRRPDVIYAFGHGHLGLTLGPTTGRLVADLVAGRVPPIDVAPYSIIRFS